MTPLLDLWLLRPSGENIEPRDSLVDFFTFLPGVADLGVTALAGAALGVETFFGTFVGVSLEETFLFGVFLNRLEDLSGIAAGAESAALSLFSVEVFVFGSTLAFSSK